MKSQIKGTKKSKGQLSTPPPRKRTVNQKTLNPKQAPIYAYTFKDASRLSGIRLTTLRKWLVSGKIARGKDGAFNVTELLQLGAQENGPRTGASRSPKAERARDRYWQSKAEAMEIEVKVQKGELISKSEVVEALVARELVFKNRLMALPSIFASQLADCEPPEIESVCREHIYALLRDLARRGSEGYKNAQPGVEA
jgi:hypothetical protein